MLEQKITTAAESIFFNANSKGFIQPWRPDKKEMNLTLWRLLIGLRNLTILAAKGEDKESRKQLKQGSKNISFFAFINFPANMSYTLALGSKEVYTVSSTWGLKMINNTTNQKEGELYDFGFVEEKGAFFSFWHAAPFSSLNIFLS